MMSLFVFWVLLFGLFSVFMSQYIMQYREAYALWIKEIVYAGEESHSNCDKKKALCSKLESYSREICGLTDMILVLFIMICVTFLIIAYTIKNNLPLMQPQSTEYNITLASGTLTLMLFFALPFILYYSKINIISSSMTSAIDDKIFTVWYRFKCHDCKKKEFQDKLKPDRVYEILAEKINREEIRATDEEIDLIRPLLRKKDVYFKP